MKYFVTPAWILNKNYEHQSEVSSNTQYTFMQLKNQCFKALYFEQTCEPYMYFVLFYGVQCLILI